MARTKATHRRSQDRHRQRVARRATMACRASLKGQNAPRNTERLSAPNVLPPAGDHTIEAQEQHVQPRGAKVQAVTTIQPIPIQSLINTTNENPQKTCTLTCCDEAHNVQSAGDK